MVRLLWEVRGVLIQPLRPEDEKVNPGVYGEELALWIAARLAETEGAETRVDYEDWAWPGLAGSGPPHDSARLPYP